MFHPDTTILASLLGGAMIGLASVLFLALQGRIAGISGIVGGLLPPMPEADWSLRLAFLGGFVVAPAVATVILGSAGPFVVTNSLPSLLVGGALVGFGTIWGYGCTSGHGVCGLSRLSQRSMLATAVFMVFAALTVLVVRDAG